MTTNNIVALDPYAQGKRDYYKGKNWTDCPYAHMPLSPHFYQWMCGWDDASLEPQPRGTGFARLAEKHKG